MKNRFDLLIFDWDGTLFDSVHWIVECLHYAAGECGLPVPSERSARSVIGLSLERAMRTLFPQARESDIDPLMAAYHHYYDTRPIGPESLFAGVPQMLEVFRDSGYKLAVATGKNRPGLEQALSGTGASGWFHATRCAGETASKPDPLMLRQIMVELDAPPERTLMVGDSVHDLQMARNAGVEAVGVYCGANEPDELLAFQPLLGLEQTTELLELLV